MKLNLFTNGTHHTLVDTVEILECDTFSITPITNEKIGEKIYPRVVNTLFGKSEIDTHVKLPSGMSARFSVVGGQVFIEPFVLYHSQDLVATLNEDKGE